VYPLQQASYLLSPAWDSRRYSFAFPAKRIALRPTRASAWAATPTVSTPPENPLPTETCRTEKADTSAVESGLERLAPPARLLSHLHSGCELIGCSTLTGSYPVSNFRGAYSRILGDLGTAKNAPRPFPQRAIARSAWVQRR
jgi:hypothetical protein